MASLTTFTNRHSLRAYVFFSPSQLHGEAIWISLITTPSLGKRCIYETTHCGNHTLSIHFTPPLLKLFPFERKSCLQVLFIRQDSLRPIPHIFIFHTNHEAHRCVIFFVAYYFMYLRLNIRKNWFALYPDTTIRYMASDPHGSDSFGDRGAV
jgi:hypothetical protein